MSCFIYLGANLNPYDYIENGIAKTDLYGTVTMTVIGASQNEFFSVNEPSSINTSTGTLISQTLSTKNGVTTAINTFGRSNINTNNLNSIGAFDIQMNPSTVIGGYYPDGGYAFVYSLDGVNWKSMNSNGSILPGGSTIYFRVAGTSIVNNFEEIQIDQEFYPISNGEFVISINLSSIIPTVPFDNSNIFTWTQNNNVVNMFSVTNSGSSLFTYTGTVDINTKDFGLTYNPKIFCIVNINNTIKTTPVNSVVTFGSTNYTQASQLPDNPAIYPQGWVYVDITCGTHPISIGYLGTGLNFTSLYTCIPTVSTT